MTIETAMANGHYKEFLNCGEIFLSIESRKTIYALSCIFCNKTFKNLKDFTVHIEFHKKEIIRRLKLASIITDDDIEVSKNGTDSSSKEYDENEVKTVAGAGRHHQMDDHQSFEMNTEQDTDEEEEMKDQNESKISLEGNNFFKQRKRKQTLINKEASPKRVKTETSNIEFTEDTQEQDSSVVEASEIGVIETVEDEQESSVESEVDDSNSLPSLISGRIVRKPLIEGVNIFQNEEFAHTFIAAYKKERILWNPNETMSRNTKKRKEAYERMRKELLHLKSTLTVEQVRYLIGELRRQYSKEWGSAKDAKSMGKRFRPSCYYESLSFLQASISYKQYERRHFQRNEDLLRTKLTNSQSIELIKIYERFRSLWDYETVEYRFENERMKCLEEISEVVREKMQLDFALEELLHELKRIHYIGTLEKERKLKCEKRNENYVAKNSLYEHIKFLEIFVPPFPCPYCGKYIYYIDKFRVHKSEHDGTKPFNCQICGVGVTEAGNFKVHLKRHLGHLTYECKICGKGFVTSTEVIAHMRSHTGEKPFFCEICGKSFSMNAQLSIHMLRHKNVKNYNCTVCPKRFIDNRRLREHMLIHTGVRDKICNICGKAFISNKLLKQHRLIHEEVKKYVCKICGKDFAQYAGLSGHMKSHRTTMKGNFTEGLNK